MLARALGLGDFGLPQSDSLLGTLRIFASHLSFHALLARFSSWDWSATRDLTLATEDARERRCTLERSLMIRHFRKSAALGANRLCSFNRIDGVLSIGTVNRCHRFVGRCDIHIGCHRCAI